MPALPILNAFLAITIVCLLTVQAHPLPDHDQSINWSLLTCRNTHNGPLSCAPSDFTERIENTEAEHGFLPPFKKRSITSAIEKRIWKSCPKRGPCHYVNDSGQLLDCKPVKKGSPTMSCTFSKHQYHNLHPRTTNDILHARDAVSPECREASRDLQKQPFCWPSNANDRCIYMDEFDNIQACTTLKRSLPWVQCTPPQNPQQHQKWTNGIFHARSGGLLEHGGTITAGANANLTADLPYRHRIWLNNASRGDSEDCEVDGALPKNSKSATIDASGFQNMEKRYSFCNPAKNGLLCLINDNANLQSCEIHLKPKFHFHCEPISFVDREKRTKEPLRTSSQGLTIAKNIFTTSENRLIDGRLSLEDSRQDQRVLRNDRATDNHGFIPTTWNPIWGGHKDQQCTSEVTAPGTPCDRATYDDHLMQCPEQGNRRGFTCTEFLEEAHHHEGQNDAVDPKETPDQNHNINARSPGRETTKFYKFRGCVDKPNGIQERTYDFKIGLIQICSFNKKSGTRLECWRLNKRSSANEKQRPDFGSAHILQKRADSTYNHPSHATQIPTTGAHPHRCQMMMDGEIHCKLIEASGTGLTHQHPKVPQTVHLPHFTQPSLPQGVSSTYVARPTDRPNPQRLRYRGSTCVKSPQGGQECWYLTYENQFVVCKQQANRDTHPCDYYHGRIVFDQHNLQKLNIMPRIRKRDNVDGEVRGPSIKHWDIPEDSISQSTPFMQGIDISPIKSRGFRHKPFEQAWPGQRCQRKGGYKKCGFKFPEGSTGCVCVIGHRQQRRDAASNDISHSAQQVGACQKSRGTRVCSQDKGDGFRRCMCLPGKQRRNNWQTTCWTNKQGRRQCSAPYWIGPRIGMRHASDTEDVKDSSGMPASPTYTSSKSMASDEREVPRENHLDECNEKGIKSRCGTEKTSSQVKRTDGSYNTVYHYDPQPSQGGTVHKDLHPAYSKASTPTSASSSTSPIAYTPLDLLSGKNVTWHHDSLTGCLCSYTDAGKVLGPLYHNRTVGRCMQHVPGVGWVGCAAPSRTPSTLSTVTSSIPGAASGAPSFTVIDGSPVITAPFITITHRPVVANLVSDVRGTALTRGPVSSFGRSGSERADAWTLGGQSPASAPTMLIKTITPL